MMKVKSLGWLGTRTDRASDLAAFYEDVLGLRLVHHEAGFWVYELPDGRHVEVFDTNYPDKDHFLTGPVAGLVVEDFPSSVDELKAAGVELLGPPGSGWQHFRGPDGNIYELIPDLRSS